MQNSTAEISIKRSNSKCYFNGSKPLLGGLLPLNDFFGVDVFDVFGDVLFYESNSSTSSKSMLEIRSFPRIDGSKIKIGQKLGEKLNLKKKITYVIVKVPIT